MSKLVKVLAGISCCFAVLLCAARFAVALPSGLAHPHYERPSTRDGPYKERVVVFVHGIFGDGDQTWRYSPSVYWPRLLLSDEAFRDSDVYVASYSSPRFGNTMNVDEIVTSLNNRLINDGVFSKHHEVVFVCHSLGGLVVQRLLVTFRKYAEQVRLIYFFSTPETGAEIAKLGAVFSSDPLLKAMFPGDENDYLQNLENEWRAAQFHIHRYRAYEKKKYKDVLVVDRLSSTRNCDEPPIAINEDHLGIVKPDSTEHESYIALRNAVIANPISHRPATPVITSKLSKRSTPAPGPRLLRPLITMQISPSTLPIYVLPHSVTSVLQLHPYIRLTEAQDGLLKIANDTGKEGCWPSREEVVSQHPNDHETVYHAEIGNHSQRTVASGRITFGLKYNVGDKGGSCMPPSGTQYDQQDVVLIPPLDAGKSFAFYVVNQSNQCVWLMPPNSATVRMDGDERESEVALTFDKNPLYAAGAPVFSSTTIKWNGIPMKRGGLGIVRTGSGACESGSQLPTPPVGKPEVEPDVRALLASGSLSQGWTLHKRNDSVSLYLIVNSDQLSRPMINAMEQSDMSLNGELARKAVAFWEDVHSRVPAPSPLRTEYGELKDQQFVEHVVHDRIVSPQKVTWNYEVFRNGSGITPDSAPFKDISLGDLSAESRQTINELDALAIHMVNRRYVDAMVKVSK